MLIKITNFKFLLIILCLISFESFSKEPITTLQAISKIEKILLDPNIDFKNKGSRYNLNNTTLSNSNISIQIKEQKINQENRLRIKAAYEASLSGQYEAAKSLYKKILKTEKNNYYAKFGLATSYHQLKQYKEAKQHYYELLSHNIDNRSEIISNFLQILVEESPIEAKYFLSRLSSRVPNNQYILAQSAISFARVNQLDGAIFLLRKVISINPNNPEHNLNLAVVLDRNKEYEDAVKYYKTAFNQYIASNYLAENSKLKLIKQRVYFIENNL